MEYTIEQIRELVTTDDEWAIHAILALYERQTADEQDSRQTSHKNRMGFTGVDAGFLSDLAIRILDKKERYPKHPEWWLTEGQLKAAKPKLGKYAKQLYTIAAEKAASANAAIKCLTFTRCRGG